MASKLIKCSSCEQEIASSAKSCPQCGAKSLVSKKWWVSVIAVILIGTIGLNLGGCGSTPSQSTETSNAIETLESVVDTLQYGVGTYLVGTDIEAGLYRVVLTETSMNIGYVERSSGVSMDSSEILANIVLTGDGYVEIKETDAAVKLTGVELFPVSLDELTPDIKTEVSDGIYLVGYDINPGTYKVEVTETVVNMGYVERTSSVAMNFSDIIANEVFQGQGYIEVKEGDFAIRVQGATLVLQ